MRATASGETCQGDLPAIAGVRTLILHLARATDRIELVQQAEAQNLAATVLNASDGLDTRFKSRVLPSRPEYGTCADVIGAIFETHRRAWQRAAEAADDEEQHFLVLEDDVVFPTNFSQLLQRRLRELPNTYDLAMVGTTSTPKAAPYEGSKYLLRPDPDDPNKQALLGFWAYLVSRRGARKLLELRATAALWEGRPTVRRRVYQPVDLFVSHRLAALDVYMMKPPAPLAREFARVAQTKHPSIQGHTQLGIVSLRETPSTNQPVEDAEAASVRAMSAQMGEHFHAERFEEAIDVADQALRSLRGYPCWHIATTLQNFGLAHLRVLNRDERRAESQWASATLRTAREAFASSIRYAEGTWQERQRRHQIPQWIAHALHERSQLRLPAVEETPRTAEVPVGADGAYLRPAELTLLEPPHRPHADLEDRMDERRRW